MQNKELSSIVFEMSEEQVVKATDAQRAMAIIQKDFDDFTAMKKYVLNNLHLLRGQKVLIEVDSIQHLPSHECIIINNLELVSYTECREMIVKIKEQLKEEDADE